MKLLALHARSEANPIGAMIRCRPERRTVSSKSRMPDSLYWSSLVCVPPFSIGSKDVSVIKPDSPVPLKRTIRRILYFYTTLNGLLNTIPFLPTVRDVLTLLLFRIYHSVFLHI